MISHISVVARKWIIIIQAKYLMFPLFERANKQMRHQQFIARTITQRLFPTVRPGLAWQPRLALSASELCWDGASSGFRPPLHWHTQTHTRTDQSHTLQHNTYASVVTQCFLPTSLAAKRSVESAANTCWKKLHYKQYSTHTSLSCRIDLFYAHKATWYINHVHATATNKLSMRHKGYKSVKLLRLIGLFKLYYLIDL